MDIKLPFDFSENTRVFMRRAGYAEHYDPHTGKTSYVRRLTGDFYPRFHVYIEEKSDRHTYLRLHLDQKKPSYAGAHAHNAEYEGGRVDQEGKRLAGLVDNQMHNQQQAGSGENSPRSSLWSKLFK